jgi:hypothetical protein
MAAFVWVVACLLGCEDKRRHNALTLRECLQEAGIVVKAKVAMEQE